MIKVVGFLARNPALPAEAFLELWREGQAQVWRALPGLRGAILNVPAEYHSRADVPVLDIAPFDVIEELWFDNEAAWQAARASPPGAAMRAAEAGSLSGLRRFVTEEAWQVPMAAGPRPLIKSFTAIRRRDDATPAAFQHAWRVVHGAMAATVPLLRGFVLSGIRGECAPDGVPPLPMETPLDGIAESWCADMAARRAMVVSPEAKHWFADGATFLGRVKTVLLEEQVVLAPPG